MPGGGGHPPAQALAIRTKGFHPGLTAVLAAADTPPPTLADRETMGADLGPLVPSKAPRKPKLLSVVSLHSPRASHIFRAVPHLSLPYLMCRSPRAERQGMCHG
jgi:hypothetical protein